MRKPLSPATSIEARGVISRRVGEHRTATPLADRLATALRRSSSARTSLSCARGDARSFKLAAMNHSSGAGAMTWR